MQVSMQRQLLTCGSAEQEKHILCNWPPFCSDNSFCPQSLESSEIPLELFYFLFLSYLEAYFEVHKGSRLLVFNVVLALGQQGIKDWQVTFLLTLHIYF